MSTSIIDAVAKYHHPHFIAAKPGRWEGSYEFTFQPFSGAEPEPKRPDTYGLFEDPEAHFFLNGEYRAARILWGQARFRMQVQPVLTGALPVWQEYARARKAMDAAYAGFWETDDNRWRARLLKLVDAHSAALAAAHKWDRAAEGLAKLEREHLRCVGEEHELLLRDVAAEFGMNIKDWFIGCLDDYQSGGAFGRSGSPLADEVAKQIEDQMQRLKEVAAAAGDR